MKRRVLLIEPDAVLADVYTCALEREGYRVDWCAHAQDAISAADNKRPDVVVLEMQLAGHGGVEFLYEFRSYPEWRSIPVVLQTLVPPVAVGLSRQQRQLLGISAILYKPAAKLRHLVSAVKGSLEPVAA